VPFGVLLAALVGHPRFASFAPFQGLRLPKWIHDPSRILWDEIDINVHEICNSKLLDLIQGNKGNALDGWYMVTSLKTQLRP
jgi:hypothetical protein